MRGDSPNIKKNNGVENMSIWTKSFNDITGDPYGTSSRASRRDIMDGVSYDSPSLSPGNPFSTDNMQGNGVNHDPIFGEQQSVTDSLVNGDTRTETLMEKMYPDKSYAPPKIDAGSKMRNVNKVVTDGAKVSAQTNNAMAETKEKIAEFQQDWGQAKTEILDALKESAEGMGIDPMAATDSLIPDSAATKGTALMYMAGQMALGAGTFATFMQPVLLVGELSKKDQELPKEQQEALIKDMLKNLQSDSAASKDTRAEAGSSGLLASADDSKGSDVAWENFAPQDVLDFLAADNDGLDQPEMQELLQMEHDLEVVLDNHAYVAENYGRTNVMEKAVALASTGQSDVAVRELNSAVVAVDAPSVNLSSENIGGIVTLNTGGISSGEVAFASVSDIVTRIDETEVNQPVLANELTGYAMSQFNV